MSQETLHDYLDRAERALSRIEAAMAKRKAQKPSITISPASRSDRELKLREEVTQVIVELDRLMADAEKSA